MLMVQCEFDTLVFEEEKKALKEMGALLNMLSTEDIIGCQFIVITVIYVMKMCSSCVYVL